jgi:hypothetical protein
MDTLVRFIEKIIAKGQERGEIRPTVEGAAYAPLMIGIIEGGLLFARLYDDPAYVHRAVEQVIRSINTELRMPA